MPAKNAGGGKTSTGGATASVPFIDHLVYISALAHSHVLTDGSGRYAALLCRDSGRLQRLPRGVKA